MPTRRYEIEADDANRLIFDAEDTGRPIQGITFPAMEFRARRLRSVTFVDCDVGQLSFVGPVFRPMEIIGCRFVDCSGPHHVRYRRIRFRDCQWDGGSISGEFQSCGLDETSFLGTEVVDLIIQKCELNNVVMDGIHGQGLTIQDSVLRSDRIGGRMKQVNLVDLRVDDFDISSLHVIDGGLLGIVGTVRFPDFEDSFVVSAEAVAEAVPIIRSKLRPEAHATLELLVSDGFALEWFDTHRLDAQPDDRLPRLMPNEQASVLHILWENRLLAIRIGSRGTAGR
jgi:hypothetical protein